MNIENLSPHKSLGKFLQGNQDIAYSVLADKTERYQFICKILVKFSDISCSKKDKNKRDRYFPIPLSYRLTIPASIRGTNVALPELAMHLYIDENLPLLFVDWIKLYHF